MMLFRSLLLLLSTAWWAKAFRSRVYNADVAGLSSATADETEADSRCTKKVDDEETKDIDVELEVVGLDGEQIGTPILFELGPDSTKEELLEEVTDDAEFQSHQAPKGHYFIIKYEKGKGSGKFLKVNNDKALQKARLCFVRLAATEEDTSPSIVVQVALKESKGFQKLDNDLKDMLRQSLSEVDANEAGEKLFDEGITSLRDLTLIEEVDADNLPSLYESSSGDANKAIGKKLQEKLQKARQKEVKQEAVEEADENKERHQKIKEARSEFDNMTQEVEALRSKFAAEAKSDREQISNEAKEKLQAVLQKIEAFDTKASIELKSNISWLTAQAFLDQVKAQTASATEIFDKPDLSVMELIHMNTLLRGRLLKYPVREGDLNARNTLVRLQRGVEPTKLLTHPLDQTTKYFSRQFESESSITSAKMAVEDAGTSFAGNAWGQAAGFLGGGVGSLSIAASYANANQKMSELQDRQSTEQRIVHSLTVNSQPEASIVIDMNKLDLTRSVTRALKEVTNTRDKKRRSAALRLFFNTYGSHVCAQVTLGGYMMVEAKLTTKIQAQEGEVKKALSDVTSTKGSAAGMMLTVNGVGRAGGAADHKGDNASAETSGSQSSDHKQETTAKTSWKGGQPHLPMGLWRQSLKNNANWRLIDLNLGQCYAAWDFVRQRKTTFKGSELTAQELADTMFQVWYTTYLGLTPKKDGLPKEYTSEKEVTDWIVNHYNSGTKDDLKALEDCDAKGWCNQPHGTCDLSTGSCSCEMSWGGNTCSLKQECPTNTIAKPHGFGTVCECPAGHKGKIEWDEAKARWNVLEACVPYKCEEGKPATEGGLQGKCKACLPQEKRKMDDHCDSCNYGYVWSESEGKCRKKCSDRKVAQKGNCVHPPPHPEAPRCEDEFGSDFHYDREMDVRCGIFSSKIELWCVRETLCTPDNPYADCCTHNPSRWG